MPSKDDVLSQKVDRVKQLIQQFPQAASNLNSATDQLGKSVGQLDAVLKKFSLGIPTWVRFSDSVSADRLNYFHEDLGYAKIGGKWGIAIRSVHGDERANEEDEMEQWLFPDAPRLLRVQAIEKIPELLEALLEGAAEMSKGLKERAMEVDALTAGINSVIELQNPPAPAPRGTTSIGDLMKRTGDFQFTDPAVLETLLAVSEAAKPKVRK